MAVYLDPRLPGADDLRPGTRSRRLAFRSPFASGILRQAAYVLLPSGGIWLILRVLAELPANDWAVRVAETVFALTGLYMLLRVAQASVMSLVDEQMRAPKLLLDILRIGLSLASLGLSGGVENLER